MEYKPMDNQGAYKLDAELKRNIDAAALRQAVDVARYPLGGTMGGRNGLIVTNDIGEALNAIAGVLRLGVHTIQQLVNLRNPVLDPGLIWEGRIHFLVSDDSIQREDSNPCDFCSLKQFCAMLQDKANDDNQICDELRGETGYHFEMLDVKLPEE